MTEQNGRAFREIHVAAATKTDNHVRFELKSGIGALVDGVEIYFGPAFRKNQNFRSAIFKKRLHLIGYPAPDNVLIRADESSAPQFLRNITQLVQYAPTVEHSSRSGKTPGSVVFTYRLWSGVAL